MTVDFDNELKDVLVEARDLFRADATLLGFLGIASGIAKNHIFYNRPVDQKEMFPLPRIVCESSFVAPGRTGDNPDGLHDDVVTFVATLWVAESSKGVGRGTAYSASHRMRVLLDQVNFTVTQGGNGYFNVLNVSVVPDGDRPNTLQCQVLVEAKNIITDGVS